MSTVESIARPRRNGERRRAPTASISKESPAITGVVEMVIRPPIYQRRAPLRSPLVPRNGCGRPGRAPERFLPLDITSLLLHVIFDARFLLRQYERQRFLRVHAR